MNSVPRTIEVISCTLPEEYITVLCRDAGGCLPVLSDAQTIVHSPAYAALSIQVVPFREYAEGISGDENGRTMDEMIAAINAQARSGRLMIASQKTIPVACMLALHFRYALAMADMDDLPTILSLSAGYEYVWMAGLASELHDRLQFGLLVQAKENFDQGLPLFSLASFSFFTGRNLSELSELGLKIILGAALPLSKETTLLGIRPQKDESAFCIEKIGEHGGRNLVIKDFKEFFTGEVIDVVSSATHGFEACANGGNGNVFCGLKQSRNEADLLERSNNLGCGFDLVCPRGPRPFPLEYLPARVFMLASCNGLRLADSVMNDHFNLGLSFLDGYGEAYISNFNSSSGNTALVALFNALMHSGWPLGKSVLMMNLFLLRSGFDHPSVSMIGNPEYSCGARIVEEGSSPVIEDEAIYPPKALSCFFQQAIRGMGFKEMVLLQDNIDGDDNALWFSYPRSDQEEISDLFIFDNKAIPDTTTFKFVSLNEVQEKLAGLKSSALFWLRYHRYLKDLSTSTVEIMEELQGVVQQVTRYEKHIIKSFRYSCLSKSYLDKLELLVTQLVELAMQNYLQVTDVQMSSASFWLLNSYSDDFRIAGLSYTTCPNCGTQAIKKELHNLYEPEERLATICPKCGIIEDTPAPSLVREFSIGIEGEIFTDSRADIMLSFSGNSNLQETEVTLLPRISAFGLHDYVPEPAVAVLHSVEEGKRYEFRFQFDMDDRVPVHRYFLKVMMVSKDNISFFSRPFFVRQKYKAHAAEIKPHRQEEPAATNPA